MTELECNLCQKLHDVSVSSMWSRHRISHTKFATAEIIFSSPTKYVASCELPAGISGEFVPTFWWPYDYKNDIKATRSVVLHNFLNAWKEEVICDVHKK